MGVGVAWAGRRTEMDKKESLLAPSEASATRPVVFQAAPPMALPRDRNMGMMANTSATMMQVLPAPPAMKPTCAATTVATTPIAAMLNTQPNVMAASPPASFASPISVSHPPPAASSSFVAAAGLLPPRRRRRCRLRLTTTTARRLGLLPPSHCCASSRCSGEKVTSLYKLPASPGPIFLPLSQPQPAVGPHFLGLFPLSHHIELLLLPIINTKIMLTSSTAQQRQGGRDRRREGVNRPLCFCASSAAPRSGMHAADRPSNLPSGSCYDIFFDDEWEGLFLTNGFRSDIHTVQPTSAGDVGEAAMEVTYDNFEALLPRIEEALATCQFCAIDAEFTGLSLGNPRREDVLDDAEQRYAKVRTSAQHFLIMQFGLSTFHWNNEEGCYQAQTYNFYTFPRANGGIDVRFTCQASSLDFLREHGFDFNKFIYSGIPYITLEQLRWERRSELQEPRGAIVLRKEEDLNFVAQQMENVRAWVDSTVVVEVGDASHDLQPPILILEPSNSYLRAALYQHLEQEYGKSDFYIEHVRTAGTRKSSLKLTRATSEVIAAQDSEVAAKRQRRLERARGFATVMQALTTCNKPVVGHNMLLDLAYLYQQFVGPLPPSVDEFREQVKLLFPGGVYDTKYLASSFPMLLPYTSLEELHSYLAPRRSESGNKGSAGGVEHSASAPGFVDGSGSNDHTTMAPERDVAGDHTNGEGSARSTTSEGQEEGSDAHVIHADLSQLVTDTQGQLTDVELPKIDHANEFDRYRNPADEPGRYHEAGFDAYMTGTIFVWLSKLFEARGSSSALGKSHVEFQAVEEFSNRVFVMRSDLPFLPLQGPIPVPDRSSMFMLTSTDGLPLPSQDEIMVRFRSIGCNIDNILWLNQMTCYVTLNDSNQAPVVTQAIKDSGWHLMFGPFRSTAEFQEPLIQL